MASTNAGREQLTEQEVARGAGVSRQVVERAGEGARCRSALVDRGGEAAPGCRPAMPSERGKASFGVGRVPAQAATTRVVPVCGGGGEADEGRGDSRIPPGEPDDLGYQRHERGPAGRRAAVVDHAGERGEGRMGASGVVAPGFSREQGGELHEAPAVVRDHVPARTQHRQMGRRRCTPWRPWHGLQCCPSVRPAATASHGHGGPWLGRGPGWQANVPWRRSPSWCW